MSDDPTEEPGEPVDVKAKMAQLSGNRIRKERAQRRVQQVRTAKSDDVDNAGEEASPAPDAKSAQPEAKAPEPKAAVPKPQPQSQRQPQSAGAPSGKPTLATLLAEVNPDDADTIAEILRELVHQETGKPISVLEKLGDELEVDPMFAREAIVELENRRSGKRLQGKARVAAAKRFARLSVLGVLVVIGVVLAVPVGMVSSINDKYIAVEAQAGMAKQAGKRREGLVAYMEKYSKSGAGTALEKMDERIDAEQQRYTEVATEYNEAASSFPGSIAHKIAGLPKSVPTTLE